MEDLIHDLQRIGFRENEARVYLVLLQSGKARAGEVARQARVNRATTYHTLSGLVSRGLANVLSENGEKVFVAEPPSRVLNLLYLEMQQLEERRRLADPLMMRLQVFHNSGAGKPKIRYIESVEGLRLMQREYEQLEGDILQIVGYDAFLTLHDPRGSKEHRKELERRKRSIRSILVTDRIIKKEDFPDVELVVLPPQIAPIEGEMTTCGDRLALFSYSSGLIAVEIHSKTIAETARQTLELAWREAKRLEKGL